MYFISVPKKYLGNHSQIILEICNREGEKEVKVKIGKKTKREVSLCLNKRSFVS